MWIDFACCRGMRLRARNPRATRAYIMEESSTQSRERVKGQCPLENLQIPLAKRGKCGYNGWECARMGTAQDKPWKASRGGCEPGQDCLMTNHPGARFSEGTRMEVSGAGRERRVLPLSRKQVRAPAQSGQASCLSSWVVPRMNRKKHFRPSQCIFMLGRTFLFAPQQRQQE